jgi:hypothetical protein
LHRECVESDSQPYGNPLPANLYRTGETPVEQHFIRCYRLSSVEVLGSNSTMKHVRFGLSACLLLSSFGAFAASQPAASVSQFKDPIQLVRRAVQNEIKANHDAATHFMFRGIKTTAKGSTTKIYVETNEVTAGLVVAYDGKPLTTEQRRSEQERLERMVHSPEELRKKRAQEHEDAERSIRIMRALPEAFLFEYAGEENGSDGIGRTGDPLVNLKFHPNPAYKPPSHVEEVLVGMQGHILVDPQRARIASIDGTLFRQVGFGWGILGRLNQGGHFVVHQQEVGDDTWEVSSMTVNFTGKIMMVKNLTIQSTEVYSGFKKVPTELTFAQALELLKKEETVAENPRPTASLAQK